MQPLLAISTDVVNMLMLKSEGMGTQKGLLVVTSSRQVVAASSWMPLLERTYSFLRHV